MGPKRIWNKLSGNSDGGNVEEPPEPSYFCRIWTCLFHSLILSLEFKYPTGQSVCRQYSLEHWLAASYSGAILHRLINS